MYISCRDEGCGSADKKNIKKEGQEAREGRKIETKKHTPQIIRKIRKHAGVFLRELGDMVGMSGASLSKYENGISKIPDEVVLKICEVLKVDEGVFSDPDNIEKYCSFVPTKVDYESIRERVRQLRKESGMTREEFANSCGCSFSVLAKIEQGITNPSDTVLETIADGVDVGFAWLKYGDERLRKSPVNKKLISWCHSAPKQTKRRAISTKALHIKKAGPYDPRSGRGTGQANNARSIANAIGA